MRKPLLRRLGDGFSEVQRVCEGTAVCIGGGPSLTTKQVDAVRGLPIVAINDAYRIAPFADVCYFADARWHGWHKGNPAFQEFSGQKCTIAAWQNSCGIVNEWAEVSDPAVHVLRDGGCDGLSRDARRLCRGGHSGYQAINLAALAGAQTIILLGFDAREDADKAHWFGSHPDQVPRRAFRGYRESLRLIAPELEKDGVRVINCSPGTAIDAFEKMSLDEALVM